MIDSLLLGDCMLLMNDIPTASVDAIICDLPFGTTRNQWDSVLPLDELWKHYNRIIKPRGAVVLFGQSPFDKILATSNLAHLRYEWTWVKEQATGHLNCHFAPMKIHENILVFSKSGAGQNRNPEMAMVYNPQYGIGKAYSVKAGATTSKNYDTKHQSRYDTFNDGKHYMPTDVLYFDRDRDGWHPTQKPVDLLRYLIRTYTDKGGIVLDNCAGSGSTLIAAIREQRHFIGIEKNEEYWRKAQSRIDGELAQGVLQFDTDLL